MGKTILQHEHKYLQVADRIAQMIHDDLLRIGDKLPSVRLLSQEYGISMGTAFQAYYHLEAKGLIEARPKSGYYVRFNKKRSPAMPARTEPEAVANEISTAEMVAQVFRHISAHDLINFAIAAPQIDVLPGARLDKSVVHALRHSQTHCLNYGDTQGDPDLRRQIARLAFNWGGQVQANDVLVTAGCMEALALCLKAVTRQGDTVAIESPTYFGIFQVIESLGLKAVEIPTDPATGPDLDFLSKAIPQFNIRACVFVPNFSNPLGSCMPDEHKRALVALITKHRIPLIEDDIYGELYFGKQRPGTCKRFDSEGWVLHCSSVSKSLAPGYRIGWCLPGRFMEEVKQVKRMHNITGTTLTQAAMAHFLSIGRYDHHLRNLRKTLHTQCLRYTQAIIEYFPGDVKLSRPEGGFVLWLEMSQKVNAYRLYEQAMQYHISIAPGQIFSASNHYRNCIRIGYGRPYDEQVEYGLKTLGNILKAS